MRISRNLLPACGGLLGGLVAACVPRFDTAIACGDGYVDPLSDEQCDPAKPDSFLNACEGTERPAGTAACHPDTCTIINTTEQCASCGDNEIDAEQGEECDGTVPPGTLCVNGVNAVTCATDCTLDYTNCPQCGNGRVDKPNEECDSHSSGDLFNPVDCREIKSFFPKPFTWGEVRRCQSDCTWDRTECSFCGDGVLDGPWEDLSLGEVCDSDTTPDPNKLEDYCRMRCTGTVVGSLVFDCNFECAPNCLSFVDVPDEDLQCCVPPAELCPPGGSAYKCCWELDPANAMSGENPCVENVVGMQIISRCK